MKINLYGYVFTIRLIYKFIFKVFPMVDSELSKWEKEIADFKSIELAYQAAESINDKKFHCQGGSIYALYPKCSTDKMVKLIVSLQTISDYLDNLCDRTEVKEEKAFKQLHLAFKEALRPNGQVSDYYLHYPFKDDAGYLNKLVDTCRSCIKELPAYELVQDQIIELGNLYSELQVYKHLPLDIREVKVLHWAGSHLKNLQIKDISEWEFAAASGSTLAIFMLFALAFDEKSTQKDAELVLSAYFPWICGLHILLDYFIDLKEDDKWGDLNFISYYSDIIQIETRLKLFLDNALKASDKLPNSLFHSVIIQGLLALYLSDSKVSNGEEAQAARKIVRHGGTMAYFLWKMCRLLRDKNII